MSELEGANVLVTGGAGTVGSTLVDALLKGGVNRIDVLDNMVRGRMVNLAGALATGQVELIQGNIRNRDLVHDLAKGKDLVFHQAAIRITQCAEEPRLALEVLVNGTFNVFEAAAEHGADKLIAASSASVYGAAKSFNEGMARSFHAMTGLDYVMLRYFNVYGPRMDVHGPYTETLVRWMERIMDGEPPLIFGDGLQTMDFVYTADVARANVLAAASDVSHGTYNIASGTETTLLEMARTLLRVMDSDLAVEHGPERLVKNVVRRLADTTAARQDLGFEADVKLEEGLRELVSWWKPMRDGIAATRKVGSR